MCRDHLVDLGVSPEWNQSSRVRLNQNSSGDWLPDLEYATRAEKANIERQEEIELSEQERYSPALTNWSLPPRGVGPTVPRRRARIQACGSDKSVRP